jgi:hypothetical protein
LHDHGEGAWARPVLGARSMDTYGMSTSSTTCSISFGVMGSPVRMVAMSALAADFYRRVLGPWTRRALILEAGGDALYGAMATRLRELHPAAAVHAARTTGHVCDAARVAEEADAVLVFLGAV